MLHQRLEAFAAIVLSAKQRKLRQLSTSDDPLSGTGRFAENQQGDDTTKSTTIEVNGTEEQEW